MKINVARFLDRSASEGPGWRAVIWVQGCSIHCPGCCNAHLWEFANRNWVSTEDLADRIGKIQGIEGVTFLGGEPFDQAAALGELAALVRLKGLSVMTFSGYTLQQLQDKADRGIDHLLAETDLLVDGPFIQARYTTTHPWIGSDNQTIHFLTDRYAHLASESPPLRQANSVEIRLTVNGELSLNGFAHAGMRAAILEELRSRGFDLNRTDLFPKPVDERDLS